MTHRAALPDTALPSVVHAWVDGWARARGTDAPRAVPGGFRIEVRRPGHLARHVLPGADPAVLRGLVDTLTAPGQWIKACAPREAVEPLLTADWEISEPQYLMTTDRPAPPGAGDGLPSGYRLEVVDEGAGVYEARVHTGSGPALAASGRAALTTGAAGGRPAPYAPSVVFDMIGTEPAHRRRGLGRAVMDALARRAVERGARQGVLVASPEGRALYEAMGWRVRSPVTAAGRRG
ncbi:GNAT family N-acetyltransferase [Streptomyces sp. NPDC048611]|uniref:GNAT family N-acetyltransferase n=1 Tax=Streptomyces sp. NPDC048611 TaxID=3155635 RepID=UPI003434121A